MKKFLAGVALSAAALTANAEVYDLQFLNKTGEWFGRTAYNSSTLEFETVTSGSSTAAPESEVVTTSIDQDLWYGLSKTTTLQLGLGYLMSEETEVDGTSSGDNVGLRDISLGVKHRLLDKGGRMFDLWVYLSTGIGDAESGNTQDDGNGYSGRTDFGVALDYGMKKKGYQWNVIFNLDFVGAEETEDATSGTLSEVDSTMDFGLTYNALWDLSKVFSLQGTAFLDMIGERSFNDAGVDSYMAYGLGATAFYNSSKALSWFFGLTYTIGQDADVIPTSSNQTREGITEMAYNLGAVYTF